MIKLDIDDLHLIQIVSSELSFSAAATRLGISGAAVSRRLSKIENILGHKIVHRPGPFKLTRAGLRFLELADTVLHEHDIFQRDIGNIKSGNNLLKIMANPSIMISDMPQVIETLNLKNPDLQIELSGGSLTETLKAVQDGDIDVGIVTDQPYIEGLRFYKYRNDRLCVLAPISHALSQKDSATLREISAHPIIGADKSRQVSIIIDTQAKHERHELNYIVRTTDYDLQASLVAQTDIGVAIMFESIARRFANAPVKIITLNEDWAVRELSICVQDTGSLSDPCTDFMQLMIQRFSASKRNV
ncbi:LysR family transcriptional regulator [Undibacterium sp. Rencai35W]|uniref:LysR family transcriptional regulator n=1 Tax=Undibacterium sp. Rencai35W TaxID=3413046 RepID=UPI003BEFF9D9